MPDDSEDPPDEDDEQVPTERDALFKYELKKWWLHYRPRLLPDFVRVAYLLCPNPTIMEHAKDPDNLDPEDRQAVERLLDKLMLPLDIVDDNERLQKSAEILDTFYKELGDFQNKRGFFNNDKIWFIAAKPDTYSAEWHRNYSLPFTKILGKFACRVTSKICGIGEAERQWKFNKKQHKGQRGKLGANKSKMQGAVAAAYSHEKSSVRRAAAQKAGSLWEDADFEVCNFGTYCEGGFSSVAKKPTRVFRAWQESWERTQFKSSGCALFAAQFTKKYGGLMFRDLDRDGKIGWTLEDDCAVLQRCYKGKNRRTEMEPIAGWGYYYALLVCYDGYDVDKFYHQQSDELWDLFELQGSSDFYEMVMEYYEDNELMKLYQEGECSEYDATERLVPFKGLLEGDVESDSEVEEESESD